MKKGDLGGFENLQGEGIYGKRYMRKYEILRSAQDDKMVFRKGLELRSKGYWGSRRLYPAMAQAGGPCHRLDCCPFLGLARSLGDELAHLLPYFGGVALRTGDLAGFIILEAHDPHKLLAAFAADIFIGGHGSPPDERG